MKLQSAHRLFEVNYWAYADLAKQVIEPMRKQGGGTIVNVSSILGTVALCNLFGLEELLFQKQKCRYRPC